MAGNESAIDGVPSSKKNDPRGSLVESTREFLGFLTAIAVATALKGLADVFPIHWFPSDPAVVAAGNSSPLWMTLLQTALLINFNLRFYIGNFAYLDAKKHEDKQIFGIDSITLIMQGIFLAFASFFVGKPISLFIVIVIALTSDVCWWFLCGRRQEGQSPEQEKGLNHNAALSTVTIILFLFVFCAEYFRYEDLLSGPYAIVYILFAGNSIIDLVLNHDTYLGARFGVGRIG